MTPYDSDDLERRAMAAWFRTGGTDQPSRILTTTDEIDGKVYVVLRNVRGVMAVYRMRNDGVLRRMKRPPKELLDD